MPEPIDPALAVIVLAAGQGTRMRSSVPKVLHRIGGRSLLGHVLTAARRLGPVETAVVVRFERDLVAAAVVDDAPGARIVDQDEIPGTGRAVELALAALDGFDGDVLVVSADVPLIETATLAALVDTHRSERAAATMLTATLDDPAGYGRVVRGDDGSVHAVVEQKDATDDQARITEINAGVYAFRSSSVRGPLAGLRTDNAQAERYLTDVIAALRDGGEDVRAVATADATAALGVNDRVQLSQAARVLNARTVEHWQREGVTILDPATTWIDVDVTLAPDVTVLPGSQLLRATTVDEGATIGPDTSLVTCEVGADAVVTRTDATLAVIGPKATVGPFAYLRPGARLGAGGKIGTFVEVKNSTIGDGSKVPHLSYIGDTEIGDHVNLGAGAITANYDDVAKHRTVIGDHVHTGSHNVFVAPVRIADGAKTGAGAVIRKDVPPGALALSVAPQRNVEGWVETNRTGTDAATAAARARRAQRATDGAQTEDD